MCYSTGMDTTLVNWVLKRIDRNGGPDACHPWTASRKPTGYGTITWGGATLRAHRVAYEIAYGPIPAGKNVCHSCDNPPCCNPRHLWLGSQADNMADMARKGRVVTNPNRGEASIQAKLTDAEVLAIRAEYGNYRGVGRRPNSDRGPSRRQLATKYNVSKALIDHVLNGTAWKHV
jgi:hypothetical protein